MDPRPGPVDSAAAITGRPSRATRTGHPVELDQAARAALRGNARLRSEHEWLRQNNPRPPVSREVDGFSARFRQTLAAAKRSMGVGRAISHGPWINQVSPLTPAAATAIVRSLTQGVGFLHSVSRARGTNLERDRHIRDWLLFCRLLRLSPYISTARDAAALHAYVAWKALAYRGKKHKRGQAPGLSYQSVANELSSIRTFHAEALGVHLHKIDPLAKQLVKGIRRISGSVQSPLRFTQQMMLEMEVLDEQPANMGQLAWAHACARRWCFDAMLRISEIAATPTTQHFLLHKDVLFDFDEIGRPSRITWVLRSAKNSQYTMVVRDMLASPTPRDFVSMMYRVWRRNEAFLKNHPTRRHTLAFIHVKGKTLTKSQVAAYLRRRLSQIPAMGAERLRLFKTGTHCMRRGGARMWLNLGVGEAYLRWLGGWRSLAWLVYPEVADGLKQVAAAKRAAHMQAAIATLRNASAPATRK